MIELDGAQGEGGGQVLRSALTLSMITGQPFRIVSIRANRPKPGLMRQHLVAVQAAAAVCGAQVTGAELGAATLTFVPGQIKSGDYQFAIGSAGSCTLVLQTLLLALLFADAPSTVRISGGTHNPMAPPAEFLQRAFLPQLAAMGASASIEVVRAGFYPAGGGVVHAAVKPCARLRPLDLLERGARIDGYAEVLAPGIAPDIATRELACIGTGMGWGEDKLHALNLPRDHGPGNALLVTLAHEHVTEVFSAFGEKAVRAENVARQALQEARRYIVSNAAVGEHLADQLMVPLALAGSGSFTVDHVSQHALTNAAVIGRFLPVDFVFSQEPGRTLCNVQVRPDQA